MSTKSISTIGAKIHFLRTEKGMTQEQLGESANISPRTVQRLEQNQTSHISLEVAVRICMALDTNIQDLIEAEQWN